MKKLLIPVLSILFLTSCLVDTSPYLDLTMGEIFTEGDSVSLTYEFSSEADVQACRVQIWNLDDTESPFWDNGDEELFHSGEIRQLLEAGNYRLDFTVLSSRGGTLKELPFLSKSILFRVESIF